MPKKKKHKIIRYLKVSRGKARKLNRKKISVWVNENLKGHPFILGVVAFIWFNYVIRLFFKNTGIARLMLSHLTLVILLSVAWLVLVVVSNLLKDNIKNVRWFFKKRFIFFVLILFPPLGVILLWIGPQFKRITRIVLTIIFGALFIYSNFSYEKDYQRVLNMSAFDNVADMIIKQKAKIYLEKGDSKILANFKFVRFAGRQKTKLALSEVYAQYSPGVVEIKTKDKSGKQLGLGSGFVISKDGLIVTNLHVLKSAYDAEIKIGDKVYPKSYLIKYSPKLDLAIIKIDAEGLPVLAIGDSAKAVSGQVVIALGSPLGFEHSISSGIISAMRSGLNLNLIQMTAPVSPGSSGGPLMNEYGEVIGINTIATFFYAQNVNFAIPVNYLKELVDQKNK